MCNFHIILLPCSCLLCYVPCWIYWTATLCCIIGISCYLVSPCNIWHRVCATCVGNINLIRLFCSKCNVLICTIWLCGDTADIFLFLSVSMTGHFCWLIPPPLPPGWHSSSWFALICNCSATSLHIIKIPSWICSLSLCPYSVTCC